MNDLRLYALDEFRQAGTSEAALGAMHSGLVCLLCDARSNLEPGYLVELRSDTPWDIYSIAMVCGACSAAKTRAEVEWDVVGKTVLQWFEVAGHA